MKKQVQVEPTLKIGQFSVCRKRKPHKYVEKNEETEGYRARRRWISKSFSLFLPLLRCPPSKIEVRRNKQYRFPVSPVRHLAWRLTCCCFRRAQRQVEVGIPPLIFISHRRQKAPLRGAPVRWTKTMFLCFLSNLQLPHLSLSTFPHLRYFSLTCTPYFFGLSLMGQKKIENMLNPFPFSIKPNYPFGSSKDFQSFSSAPHCESSRNLGKIQEQVTRSG